MLVRKGLLAVVGLFACAIGLSAQSTGTLVVTVGDATGAVVPGARLVLKNVGTGETREAVSGNLGVHIFDLLPPGSYTLIVQKQGFASVSVQGLAVLVNTTLRQDISFQVAQVAEQVNVVANPAQVIADTPALGEVLGSRKIVDLPLNGRAFLQLATLSAGVSPPIPPIGGAHPWQSVAQGFSFLRPTIVVSISGSREIATEYLFDGISSRHQFYGAVGFQPPIDSIAEFKIQRGYFSPQFGQPAVVNVVIKSGSNELHGAAWEFLRNDHLDARNFFDAEKAPWRMNQFGFNAGGPLIKNKLFWFGDYEGLRTSRYTTSFAVVPTAQMLRGDFSGLPTISDPLTFVPATGRRTPFPNNIIPEQRIVEFAKRYQRFFRAANTAPIAARGNANVVDQTKETLDEDKWEIKLDYIRSEKDSFFGRYSHMDNTNRIGSLFPLRGTYSPLNSRNAVLAWTHVFSPTVVNNFRAGLDRANQAQGAPLQDLTGEDWPTFLGLRNLNQIPECNAAPNVIMLGYSTTGAGNGNCIIPANTSKTFLNTLSMVKGRHGLSMGGTYTRLFYKNIAALNPLGSFNFTGQFSGHSVADYLLGAPFSVNGSKPAAPGYLLGWYTDLFINDDFKVNRKLTLNGGLRWQISPPMLEKFDRLGVFDPRTGLIRVASQDGNSRRLLTTHSKDFAPRFGFAYSPGRSWVFRSSYGIYFDRPPGNDLAWNNIKFPFQTGFAQISDAQVPTINIASLFPSVTPGQLPPQGTSLFNFSDRSGDPYMQQWTVSIQRSLPASTLVEVAYVGSKGTRLSKRVDSNLAPLPAPGDTRPVQERRPYPQWSFILDDKGIGVSTYHGLQTTLRKEYSHGLTMLTGYTWARSMDTDSFDSKASRNYRPGDRDYTRSIWDIRHRFTTSLTYDLPFGKSLAGFARQAVAGWQTSAIITLQSGIPAAVLESPDRSGTGVIVSWARPNRICDGNLPPSQRRPERWFDTSCFVQPPPNTYGNAGMHYLDLDGIATADLAILKNFPIRETHKLQFRMELFNAFNHANFGSPGFVRGTSTFGVVTSAYPGRNIQFSLKYGF